MKVLDNMWKWFGVQSDVEEEYSEIPVLPERDNRSVANVVSIHSAKGIKVVVCEPERFEEAQALADHLKNRKQIVLNFEATSPEVSQKIIDFISGAVYALDGTSQQLGRNIFLFAPSTVEISKENKNVLHRHEFMPSEHFGGKR